MHWNCQDKKQKFHRRVLITFKRNMTCSSLRFTVASISFTMADLTPFEVGQIKAHHYHEVNPSEISRIMSRSDGSPITPQTVRNAIKKLESDPSWEGGREPGSGAVRKTTKAQDKKIVSQTLKNRGKVKVTVGHLKKKNPDLRAFSDTLIERRLSEASLGSLNRRDKSQVPAVHFTARLEYARWIKAQTWSFLMSIIYSDGTTFWLPRSQAEADSQKRASLGKRVWRRLDGKDSLWEDTIGPSKYGNAQGLAVRVAWAASIYLGWPCFFFLFACGLS